MKNGSMQTEGPRASRLPVASAVRIVDGVSTLVERIRVLRKRQMAAFWASPVGRRRLLLRGHADAAALAAAHTRKTPRTAR